MTEVKYCLKANDLVYVFNNIAVQYLTYEVS